MDPSFRWPNDDAASDVDLESPRPSLERRTTSVAGSAMLSAGSSRTRFISVSTSSSPASLVSWNTVVSAGLAKRAIGMSSKPTTATSSGTRRPRFGERAHRADGDQVAGGEHRIERNRARGSSSRAAS